MPVLEFVFHPFPKLGSRQFANQSVAYVAFIAQAVPIPQSKDEQRGRGKFSCPPPVITTPEHVLSSIHTETSPYAFLEALQGDSPPTRRLQLFTNDMLQDDRLVAFASAPVSASVSSDVSFQGDYELLPDRMLVDGDSNLAEALPSDQQRRVMQAIEGKFKAIEDLKNFFPEAVDMTSALQEELKRRGNKIKIHVFEVPDSAVKKMEIRHQDHTHEQHRLVLAVLRIHNQHIDKLSDPAAVAIRPQTENGPQIFHRDLPDLFPALRFSTSTYSLRRARGPESAAETYRALMRMSAQHEQEQKKNLEASRKRKQPPTAASPVASKKPRVDGPVVQEPPKTSPPPKPVFSPGTQSNLKGMAYYISRTEELRKANLADQARRKAAGVSPVYISPQDALKPSGGRIGYNT